MRVKKICGLMIALMMAMMLSGFSVIGPPAGDGKAPKTDAEAEEDAEGGNSGQTEGSGAEDESSSQSGDSNSDGQGSEQTGFDAAGGSSGQAGDSVQEGKQVAAMPLTVENLEELAAPDNWKEVTDGKGNLTIKVPATAQQVPDTEDEEFIYYELLNLDGDVVGAVKAAAYKDALPGSMAQYTDAVPKTDDAYTYKYYSMDTAFVSWDGWVGSPYWLEHDSSYEYHLFATGEFGSGMKGFVEIDLQTDAAPIPEEEIYSIAEVVLESAFHNKSSFDFGGILPVLLVIALIIALFPAYHYWLKPAFLRFKSGAEASAEKMADKWEAKREEAEERAEDGERGFRIPKAVVCILVAAVVIVLMMNQGNTPEPLLPSDAGAGTLDPVSSGEGNPIRTPSLAIFYAAALMGLLELWDRWVSSRPEGKKINVLVQRAGIIALVAGLSVVFTWLMFHTGILERAKDAIILAVYDKLYLIPFQTILDRVKAVSYLAALFAVLICLTLLARGGLRILFSRLRTAEDDEEEVVEEVQESEPEESSDTEWHIVQTESNGLSFEVPPGARRMNTMVVSSSLGRESDKAEYTFSESINAGIPRGSITVALYGEPILGLDSKFLKYSQLVDSLRNSVRSHENYKWTQKRVTEHGIEWDVWHGVNRDQKDSSEKSDYMFACCDFGDKTFGYVGASGVHSGDLGDEEVYAFLTTLLRGVRKK